MGTGAREAGTLQCVGVGRVEWVVTAVPIGIGLVREDSLHKVLRRTAHGT